MPLSDGPISINPMPSTIAGPGVAAQLGDHVAAVGQSKAFLVVDPGVVAAGLIEPIIAALNERGITNSVFSNVDPNPTDLNVAAGVAALQAFGEAAVVLIGGGSAMDCGKYVSLAAANGGDDSLGFAFHVGIDENDFIDFATLMPPQLPERDGYPVIAIPTTSGTASETNGGGLITDTTANRKLTFSHPSLTPKVVLLDPTLTLGLPPVPTATCGMDALVHSIECLTSSAATPYADAVALGAIRMVGQWLPVVIDDPANLEGRAQMQLASHMAGRAFSSGPLLGLVHAMGHPLSARLHQAHGQTLATMLPHVMRFNMEVSAAKYAQLAIALGAGDSKASDADNGAAAIDAVIALSQRVGTNKLLSELGASSDDVPGLVQDCLSDLIILTTPRYPTRDQVRELYFAAL